MTGNTSASSTPEPNGIETRGLSKRALKKLQKEQQEEEEKLAESNKEQEESQKDDEYLEYLQKRIRNLTKRKQKLDKTQELADDPTTKGQLNADQLKALENKESVEAPLKDLNELYTLYKSQCKKQEAQIKSIEKSHKKELEEKYKQAKQEGIDSGTEKLSLTIKFLRAASFKRQLTNETPAEESAAFEHLLQLIYNGDETSLNAIESLFNGDDTPVTQNTITYGEIKKIAQTPPEKFFEKDQPAEEESQVNKQQELDQQEQQLSSSLQSISFLQDEVNDDETVEQSASPTSQPEENGGNEAKPKKNNNKSKRPYYRKNRSQKQNKNTNANANGNGPAAATPNGSSGGPKKEST